MSTQVNTTPIIEAFRSTERVKGFTHDFYRYPARFPPEFVRAVISYFSEPGDWLIDPFMGGGTTIVEALALGRRIIGMDVNRLAYFSAMVKTTPLSANDIEKLNKWVHSLELERFVMDSPLTKRKDSRTANVPEDMRHLLGSMIHSAKSLRFPRQRRFARCALLRAGQWALDCKERLPSSEELLVRLHKEVERMVEGLQGFIVSAKQNGISKNRITKSRTLLPNSVAEATENTNISWESNGQKPSLVITSPPYPGVHVLYHRWQIRGRKETPAPYWIAGLRDGHGESHYTMGGRSKTGITNYYAGIETHFNALRRIITPDAVVVQLVGFSEPSVQFPMYLEAMEAAGYIEESILSTAKSDLLIRNVPNRKWYTRGDKQQSASHEVLLCHRPVIKP